MPLPAMKIGMLGMAYRKILMFNGPEKLKYLLDNADGAGTSIYQQSQISDRETCWKLRERGFMSTTQKHPMRRSSSVIRQRTLSTGEQSELTDAISWCWWSQRMR